MSHIAYNKMQMTLNCNLDNLMILALQWHGDDVQKKQELKVWILVFPKASNVLAYSMISEWVSVLSQPHYCENRKAIV